MPAANTYEAIATQTLATAAASVTFSSIPSTYTDLVIIASSANAGNGIQFNIRLNGDSATNYSATYLFGAGSTGSSARDANRDHMDIGGSVAVTGSGSNWYAPNVIHLINYANTTTYKTALARIYATSSSNIDYVQANVSMWRNTAAINNIYCYTNGFNLNAGTSISLYGIKAA